MACFLKEAVEGLALISVGRVFQILGARPEKARLYVLFFLNLGGFKSRVDVLLKLRTEPERTNLFAR